MQMAVSQEGGTDIEWGDRHEVDPVHSTLHEVVQGGTSPAEHGSQRASVAETCDYDDAHHMRNINSPEKLSTYISSSPNQTCQRTSTFLRLVFTERASA